MSATLPAVVPSRMTWVLRSVLATANLAWLCSCPFVCFCGCVSVVVWLCDCGGVVVVLWCGGGVL